MGMMKRLWEEHDRLMDLAEEMCERPDGERWPRPLPEHKKEFMAVIEAAGVLQKVAGEDERWSGPSGTGSVVRSGRRK